MSAHLLAAELEYRPAAKSLWVCAAVIALALHLALASLVFARLQQESDDADLGAPGIEIGLELASPTQVNTDLPPGPESDAAAASPDAAEQRVEEVRDLPKEVPIEAENPDRLVKIEDDKKPVEEQQETKVITTAASEASSPQEAAAPLAVENAPQAPTSTAVDQGTGQNRQRLRATWQKQLLAHLNKHKRYPANRNNKSAEVVLSLVLDRLGHVVTAGVTKSSGDSAFDAAALAMIRRADPVPAPPPLVADEGLTFSLPVVFRRSEK